VLNQPRYQGAQILLTRKNFGCGSSREHAPWALLDFGFRAVIAESFADIFFNNCFKNGILPIVSAGGRNRGAVCAGRGDPGCRLLVDLEAAAGAFVPMASCCRLPSTLSARNACSTAGTISG
jgi:3-isopropylmalate/(R)-2-methylmalate dehydratase small subunit